MLSANLIALIRCSVVKVHHSFFSLKSFFTSRIIEADPKRYQGLLERKRSAYHRKQRGIEKIYNESPDIGEEALESAAMRSLGILRLRASKIIAKPTGSAIKSFV